MFKVKPCHTLAGWPGRFLMTARPTPFGPLFSNLWRFFLQTPHWSGDSRGDFFPCHQHWVKSENAPAERAHFRTFEESYVSKLFQCSNLRSFIANRKLTLSLRESIYLDSVPWGRPHLVHLHNPPTLSGVLARVSKKGTSNFCRSEFW